MTEITIDNEKLQVDDDLSLIEVADQLGIYIPRFCYHKKLSVAANCRLCLVEVKKSSKLLPACATPVMSGMEIATRSKKVLEAQRAVLEFLLINHPLDCPICDQGGECELQDLTMGYGAADAVYREKKRAVLNESLGPLIETEMTRCIHCTRCVRFGQEIARLPELGVMHRGDQVEISTYVKHALQSELSGNMIDLCPVGALVAKPSRYSLRGWEVKEHPMIAPHDCVGSHIFVHTKSREYFKEQRVMRVVAREAPLVNENWISDRDRFSYEGVNHSERCLEPLIQRAGKWQTINWDAALYEVASKTQTVIDRYGAAKVAAVASPSSTVEEFFLLQTWLRALGSHNIDYRLREKDFSDQQQFPAFPNYGMAIVDVKDLKTLILLGSNVQSEQPIMSHWMNKAAFKGANVFIINPVNYKFNIPISGQCITADLITVLDQIIQGLEGKKSTSVEIESIVQSLQERSPAAVFLGAFCINHPQAAYIRAQVTQISSLVAGLTIGFLTEGSNAAGAYLAGAVPHRQPGRVADHEIGLNAREIFSDSTLRAHFILNCEPEYDTGAPASALRCLRRSELVVCLTPFVTDLMKSYADIILPIAPFTENEGTFINGEGRWQSFSAASIPKGKAKPAWRVIRGLARAMKMDMSAYSSVDAVRDSLKERTEHLSIEPYSFAFCQRPKAVLNHCFFRIGAYGKYSLDSVTRRARALQVAMRQTETASIALNTRSAKAAGVFGDESVTVQQCGEQLSLPLEIDDDLADGVISMPVGFKETGSFGEVMAPIELLKKAE